MSKLTPTPEEQRLWDSGDKAGAARKLRARVGGFGVRELNEAFGTRRPHCCACESLEAENEKLKKARDDARDTARSQAGQLERANQENKRLEKENKTLHSIIADPEAALRKALEPDKPCHGSSKEDL